MLQSNSQIGHFDLKKRYTHTHEFIYTVNETSKPTREYLNHDKIKSIYTRAELFEYFSHLLLFIAL